MVVRSTLRGVNKVGFGFDLLCIHCWHSCLLPLFAVALCSKFWRFDNRSPPSTETVATALELVIGRLDSAPPILVWLEGCARDRSTRHKYLPVTGRWQNELAERCVGSCRREILDHVIALNERHLRRRIGDYVNYHQDGRIPDGRSAPPLRLARSGIEPPQHCCVPVAAADLAEDVCVHGPQSHDIILH